tara:strand:- start:503 stop:730 length:228 start_codon:yes stop_codon:yes gene_type:complete
MLITGWLEMILNGIQFEKKVPLNAALLAECPKLSMINFKISNNILIWLSLHYFLKFFVVISRHLRHGLPFWEKYI